MQDYFNQPFSNAAEMNASDSFSMRADTCKMNSLTAIIPLMAVIFIGSVCSHITLNILVDIIITGIIIVIVQGNQKPVSRTR